jgi:hypothetical protein
MRDHISKLQAPFDAEESGHGRPQKSAKTSFGKGGASKRTQSAEPHRIIDDEEVNTQGVNSRVCRLFLEEPVISSRLQAAAMSFVSGLMPQVMQANSRVEFKSKSKSKCCTLTFVSAAECAAFVNRVYCQDDPVLLFQVAGQETSAFKKFKCKHDEPVEARQRKFRVSRFWQILKRCSPKCMDRDTSSLYVSTMPMRA